MSAFTSELRSEDRDLIAADDHRRVRPVLVLGLSIGLLMLAIFSGRSQDQTRPGQSN